MITEEMIQTAGQQFIMEDYFDEETGLSVSYNLFVPEKKEDTKYPLMVFIADASCVGTDARVPLLRNIGGAIWAAETEQEKHPSFVLVPNYPEVILDDHSSYTMTEYVELTVRLIESVCRNYSINADRIYGCGQSMGAMTSMYLAANHPGLYASVLIVDGQWNIQELEGLRSTRFIYIAAGGDDKALGGQKEVKEMLKKAGISFAEVADLDAQAEEDALNKQIRLLLEQGCPHNFITWKKGTVGNGRGGEHMASFPYGFKFTAVRDWMYAAEQPGSK